MDAAAGARGTGDGAHAARQEACRRSSSVERLAPRYVRRRQKVARVTVVESGLLPRFFERVTRQSFRDLALDDPPVVHYLAELLTRFAHTEALYAVRELPGRRLDSIVDHLLAIQDAWD